MLLPESDFSRDDPLPRRFGDYELIAEIGRGGMGVIYRARQIPLDRLCAVKMLRADGETPGARGEATLRAEAAAAASLDHPNIVGIYEAGLEGGIPFFSMELVEGEDLGRHVRARIFDAGSIARLMARIAEAVAYAHGRGVLHHDLKPANVVIDPAGEPQITDFGLARRIDEAGRKDPAHGAGSPNYLAPEQASARFGEPGIATDVHGLGAVLYFLLTDAPPFRGFTAEDTIRAVTDSDPIPPRMIRPGVSMDLETICLKCLQKQPARRYSSAREVAEELRRFLRDEPIQARPAGLVERGRKWCRRHPAIAALGSVVVLLLSLIAAGTTLATWHVHRARLRAETSELSARRNLYNADMLLASAAIAAGNEGHARNIVDRHHPAPGEPDLRGWEWRFLRQASRGDVQFVLGSNAPGVSQLAATPDGGFVVASDIGGNVSVWDLARRERRASRQLAPIGFAPFAFGHRHDWLLTSARDPAATHTHARIFHLPDLAPVADFPLADREHVAGFSTNDATFWTVGENNYAEYSATDGQPLGRHDLPVVRSGRDFAFSPRTLKLAVAEPSGLIHLWDIARHREIGTLQGHAYLPVWGQAIFTLEFSPDGNSLVTAGADGTVRVWNVSPPGERFVIRGHSDLVLAATFARDGAAVASAGKDRFVQWTALDDPDRPLRLKGADSVQSAICLLPDGRHAISGGLDGLIRQWGAEPGSAVSWRTNLPAGAALVTPLADGRHFASYTADSGISVLASGDATPLLHRPDNPNRVAIAAEVLPDGRIVLLEVGRDGVMTVTSGNGAPSWQRRLDERPANSPRRSALGAIDPAGRFAAAGDAVGGIQVYEIAEGLPERGRLGEHPRLIVFSPRGNWLASGDLSGRVDLWSSATGRTGATGIHHPQVSAAAFSGDEHSLATVAFDGSARIWEVATGKELARVSTSAGNLYSVGWSTDLGRLFVGSLDGILSVWDLTTGRETFVARHHRQPITGLAQNAGGDLVTYGPEGLCTWPAPYPPPTSRR